MYEKKRSFFLTDNNINSIHLQVILLANEPEVNVVDNHDFLLASGARMCESCGCEKLLRKKEKKKKLKRIGIFARTSRAAT